MLCCPIFSLLDGGLLVGQSAALSPPLGTYRAWHRRDPFKHLLSKKVESTQILHISSVYTSCEGPFDLSGERAGLVAQFVYSQHRVAVAKASPWELTQSPPGPSISG